MCQVTDELVIFSEQSGFYGRTKKVCFAQHPEMKHELGVTVQLQDETQTAPLAKHVETMHAIARFALGLDRYCRSCWSLRADAQEPCPKCIEREARRAECLDHSPLEATGGGIWCGICAAPLNDIATARETDPSWLRTLRNSHLDAVQAYRLERWGLPAKE